MEKYELINAVRKKLVHAATAMNKHDDTLYHAHMSAILFLLTEELLDGAQGKPHKPLLERS
ncbi:unnamed protein product [marine sediment metagenome]|uniref:Uncharacterized protein n=1 Tax=marine sediment metagenome TaxID=412755 RepID=X1EYM9_9ZZZZ